MKDMNKIKNLVVNIDMVYGFCVEGALADPYIKRTIPFQKQRLEKAQKEEDTAIVFINDCHSDDSVEFEFFPPHCKKGTIECKIVDELEDYSKDALTFEKNSTSGMTDEFTNFLGLIKKCPNLDKVEIQGCCTDLCIMNFAIPLRNYFNEHNMHTDVVIYEETVETFDAPNHKREEYNEWAFKFMKQNGIKIKKLGVR